MDWALNYETGRRVHPGTILIVWEANRSGRAATGLPQLLVCMAGVLEARRDQMNQSVFGMLSDSGIFTFAFLDHERKFYKSEPYAWASRQSTILAYIDAILLDAIRSSCHTVPTKSGNATLRNSQRYLKTRWRFGEEPEVKAVDDIDPESIMDVVKEGKDIVLRPEAEAVSKDEAWG